MNAVEALKMVEGIPAEQFIAGMDTDEVNKCCFLGHHSRLTSYDLRIMITVIAMGEDLVTYLKHHNCI